MAITRREFRKDIRGKTLDRIVVDAQDDCTEIEVRFDDDTSCNIRLAVSQPRIVGADLLGWRKGNSRVIKRWI